MACGGSSCIFLFRKLWKIFRVCRFFNYFTFNFSRGKNICELGAGYSGLASLALCQKINFTINENSNKNFKPVEILITDGNKICVKSKYSFHLIQVLIGLEENVKLNQSLLNFFSLNEFSTEKNKLFVQNLVWQMDFKSEMKYDRVIAADW